MTNNIKTGCVKWFNSTRGYGFITNINENGNSNDLFVHHTNLNTGENLYKTLTQGEYVEYIEKIENGKYYATEVTGIFGGKLLCENKKKINNSQLENNE